MSMIGNPIISTDFPKDTFSGTGSATAFTMSIAPASVNAVIVIVSGVVQEPSTYTISGTTLTFSGAPPAGTNNISVRHLGVAGIPNTPTAGSVTNSSFANMLTAIPFASGQSIGAGNSSLMKNRIINGAMVIDQRNAGASVTATGSNYCLDRWQMLASVSSKFTVQQNAGSVTPPAGFTNYLGVTSSAATSLGATDYYLITQKIEGFNTADLDFGKSTAKTLTLSFWVRSSLTGTFGVVIRNSAGNRLYPASYTISSANTWEQKSITIAGDTTGTWLTDIGIGIEIDFGLGVGSTYSNTAGTWTTGGLGVTGATSVVGTNGATFYITGVQLEVGASATGFEYRQYGQELALCQRYFCAIGGTSTDNGIGSGFGSGGTAVYATGPFPVQMRASPTISYLGSLANAFVTTAGVGGTLSSITNSGNGVNSWYAVLGASVGFASSAYVMFRGQANFYLTASAEL